MAKVMLEILNLTIKRKRAVLGVFSKKRGNFPNVCSSFALFKFKN